jgi:type III secretory pathway component EscV
MHLKSSRWERPCLFLLAVLSVAGCTTVAQRQAQQAGSATREAVAQSKACNAVIFAKPEYAPLIEHTPDPATGQATMALLTDESLISPQQAKLFGARHDELNQCRSRLLTALSAVRPDVVLILSSEYTNGAALAVQLVERKITWGEWARQGQALLNNARQQLAAADRKWIAELNASHQAEMGQRQAAAAALLQWSAQQQLINAANRPVVTNCNRLGSSVNCTSY